MGPSSDITVQIDLARIRENVTLIAGAVKAPVIAVVKADAYGLGIDAVAAAVGDLVEGFYVFNALEATRSRLRDIAGKRIIALMGESNDPQDYLSHGIQPVVWTVERASALRKAKPLLSIDTGQQRFGCPPDLIRPIIAAGGITEVMTHATTHQQIETFSLHLLQQTAGLHLVRHAAGSALLSDPAAAFDAVRPGLALYETAVTVTTRLHEVRTSTGPAGYSGFIAPRFGLILAGYSNGLAPGVCSINGQSRRILETGMQSSFVEISPRDRPGDEVVLLGKEITLQSAAEASGISEHQTLLRLASSGIRKY